MFVVRTFDRPDSSPPRTCSPPGQLCNAGSERKYPDRIRFCGWNDSPIAWAGNKHGMCPFYGLRLGSAGGSPAALGRWPSATWEILALTMVRFAASCRELQAGGLCSPEWEAPPWRSRDTVFTSLCAVLSHFGRNGNGANLRLRPRIQPLTA